MAPIAAVLTIAAALPAWGEGRFLGDEGPSTFAIPTVLRPNVSLWLAIYGVYDSSQQVYYDRRHLDVVLGVLDLRPYAPLSGDSARVRARKARQSVDAVEKERSRIEAALLRLERGKRRRLSELERRLLAAYARRPSALRGAHRRVAARSGLRDRFGEGLRRMALYRPYLLEILRRHRLPEEILALAMTESLFGPRARSRSGAYGIWQFLEGTGREYLHINRVVDERRDPIISTDAAARMLKSNLRRLKRWPLAITGYHYGPNGMARAARETGSYDLVRILERWRSKRFKFASRNYYASFLAALEVIRRQSQFFPNLVLPEPVRFETLAIPASMSIRRVARSCGVEVAALEALNLGLTRDALASRVSLPEGFPLRVPQQSYARCQSELRRASPPVSKARDRVRLHRVRKGESLLAIARRHGSTLPEVLALNGLRAPRHLRVGEALRVPARPRGRGFSVVPVTPLGLARNEGGDAAVGAP